MRHFRTPAVVTAIAAIAAVTAFAFQAAGPTAPTPRTETQAAAIDDLPVREFHALYYHVADDFDDLASSAIAIVRARALDSTQEPGEDPELVYTHQRFETLETYAGSISGQFTVFLTGGVVTADDGDPYLLADPDNPQYEEGAEYFLVLARHPSIPDEYVPIGPSQGRYDVVDGELRAIPGARNFAIEARLHGLSVARAAQALRDSRGRP